MARLSLCSDKTHCSCSPRSVQPWVKGQQNPSPVEPQVKGQQSPRSMEPRVSRALGQGSVDLRVNAAQAGTRDEGRLGREDRPLASPRPPCADITDALR